MNFSDLLSTSIDKLRALSADQVSAEAYSLLQGSSTAELCSELLPTFSDTFVTLMEQPQPPSFQDLLSLDHVDGYAGPGCYVDLIKSKEGDGSNFAYGGGAAYVDVGLTVSKNDDMVNSDKLTRNAISALLIEELVMLRRVMKL